MAENWKTVSSLTVIGSDIGVDGKPNDVHTIEVFLTACEDLRERLCEMLADAPSVR